MGDQQNENTLDIKIINNSSVASRKEKAKADQEKPLFNQARFKDIDENQQDRNSCQVYQERKRDVKAKKKANVVKYGKTVVDAAPTKQAATILS